MGVTFHLDECPFATLHNLVRADVLLMSKSTYACVAALLSRGVCIDESFRGTPTNHLPMPHWINAGTEGHAHQSRLRQAIEAACGSH